MKETKKQILIRLNKNTDLIKKEERKIMDTEQLKRIADILEEILRIIKKDMGIK